MTKVKICCIGSAQEAEVAINMGAAAVGLVSEMPSGPGVISEDLIAEIVPILPPHVWSFLLTSKTTVTDIIAQQKRTKANTIQLVDALEIGTIADLKKALPKVQIVQVIHVLNEQTILEAQAAAREADMLLLDSGNPFADIKILGGTGNTHNWEISRKIVETVNIPVWLAGGLRPENVREAIEKVQPFGVDLCSGVRTEGRLDANKLFAFMNAVNL